MWTIAVVIGTFLYGTLKQRAWILKPGTGRHRSPRWHGFTTPYLHTGTHRHNRDNISSVVDLVGAGRLR